MKRLHRQTELAGLLVDFNQLNSYFVAFLQAADFHVFEAIPRNFGDVKQTVLTRHEFNKCAEFEDALNLTGVNLAFFRNSHDSLDASHSSVNRLLV